MVVTRPHTQAEEEEEPVGPMALSDTIVAVKMITNRCLCHVRQQKILKCIIMSLLLEGLFPPLEKLAVVYVHIGVDKAQ